MAEGVQNHHFRLDPKTRVTVERQHPLADQRPKSVVWIWFAVNGVEVVV